MIIILLIFISLGAAYTHQFFKNSFLFLVFSIEKLSHIYLMKFINFAFILFIFILSLFFYTETSIARTEYTLSGKTMGTYYTVIFISAKGESVPLWQKRVDMRLNRVNKTFSMFDKSSRLSLFNSRKIGESIKTSRDFYEVLTKAQKIYHLSEGAWDGTVKPLVDLWGFGSGSKDYKVPELHEINKALTKIGFKHIRINKQRSICRDADIKLDLSSIAKGFGADAISELFITSGIQDVLVEIGGEVMAAGTNKKGEPWKVGISRPENSFTDRNIFQIVRLSGQALASSGTYRNFFEIDGKSYSHIIDPRTGFPVDNGIVSTSVISKNCTLADGLATAMMVMDVQKSLELADQLENTECLVVTKHGNSFITHMSKNFKIFIKEK
jgi:FAD:protein FMN transferase